MIIMFHVEQFITLINETLRAQQTLKQKKKKKKKESLYNNTMQGCWAMADKKILFLFCYQVLRERGMLFIAKKKGRFF